MPNIPSQPTFLKWIFKAKQIGELVKKKKSSYCSFQKLSALKCLNGNKRTTVLNSTGPKHVRLYSSFAFALNSCGFRRSMACKYFVQAKRSHSTAQLCRCVVLCCQRWWRVLCHRQWAKNIHTFSVDSCETCASVNSCSLSFPLFSSDSNIYVPLEASLHWVTTHPVFLSWPSGFCICFIKCRKCPGCHCLSSEKYYLSCCIICKKVVRDGLVKLCYWSRVIIQNMIS